MKLKIRDEKYYSKTWELLGHILNVVDSYNVPITSRQVFYRLVALGVVKNTSNQYSRVCGVCTKGRYTGHIDWEAIVDDTRGTHKTQDWENTKAALTAAVESFRLDRWADSPYYLEVLVEKRGMVNTLYPITDKFDVHITACGGFDSTSNVWQAVKRLVPKQQANKKIKLLYFGDFDPSGDCMDTTAQNKLAEFGLDVDIERVLLNLEHVQYYDLPVSYQVPQKKGDGTIYDKLQADPRARGFIEKHGRLMQVEIDALEPDLLIEYVENAILKYLDREKFQEIIEKENELKEAAGNFIRGWQS
jgi:hypothetical protein